MKALAGVFAFLVLASSWARAQEEYGAKGIFPVYETSGQWLIYDKKPGKAKPSPLGVGSRFLVIGSLGAQVFEAARSSGTYGGGCKGHRPVKLRAALLRGPRSAVGRPIIGIRVPREFSLTGSRAVYVRLKNEVGEDTYQRLGGAISQSAIDDAKAGTFPFKLDDPAAEEFLLKAKPQQVHSKIDFGSRLPLKGLEDPFVLVEETQISASYRRCLRLADGGRLVGACAEMPRTLMAETALLEFVAYDPGGRGSPYLMAFTRQTPLWGDERWAFILGPSGPRLFLKDWTDIRCREGF